MNVTRREFLKDSLAYLLSAANRASGGYRSALGFLALPGGKKLTIAPRIAPASRLTSFGEYVRPVSSLGTKGKTIGATWRT